MRRHTHIPAPPVFAVILCGYLLMQTAFPADIAVFYALDADPDAFMDVVETNLSNTNVQIQVMKRHTVSINGHFIQWFHMGSGCVNTAINAMQAMSSHVFDAVISCGPVGSIGSLCSTGQWVHVTGLVPYQTTANPQLRKLWNPSFGSNVVVQGVYNLLRNNPRFNGEAHCASGERFIASHSQRRKLASQTGCEVVDMNLFGLDLARQKAGIKSTLHIRIVSDFADADAGTDFSRFLSSYDGSLGALIADAVLVAPGQPDDLLPYPSLRALFE